MNNNNNIDYTEYAYIFDYNQCKIHEVKLDENTTNLMTDELLDYYDLNSDECYVMFSSKKLEIEPLTE